MATHEEIEQLKRNWRSDPCWDLEDTEGFEAHREELLAFRNEWKARWTAEREERESAKAEELGCPGNLQLAWYVLNLEQRLERLERHATNLGRSTTSNVSAE